MRLSIRWRLTLWNTLALALVLVGFSALVYWLLAEALNERLDRSLLAELNELEKDDRMANRRDERLRHWIYEFKEHENILVSSLIPPAKSMSGPWNCRPLPFRLLRVREPASPHLGI